MGWFWRRPTAEAEIFRSAADDRWHIDIRTPGGVLIFESAPRGFASASDAEDAVDALDRVAVSGTRKTRPMRRNKLGLVALLAILAGCATTAQQICDPVPGLTCSETETLLDNLASEEGFVGHVYNDQLGNPTIGYGTLLPIAPAEGRLLVLYRASQVAEPFESGFESFGVMPSEVKVDLIDAAYQLGAEGLLGFHTALGRLDAGDCAGAAAGFRNSVWDKETPDRTEHLAQAVERHCR